MWLCVSSVVRLGDFQVMGFRVVVEVLMVGEEIPSRGAGGRLTVGVLGSGPAVVSSALYSGNMEVEREE